MPISIALQDQLDKLEAGVDRLLRASPAGLSEHALFGRLRAAGVEVVAEQAGGADYTLFQRHFQLFHVLYRLQGRYWEAGEAHLEVSALSIQRLPYDPGRPALTLADPLRHYYLDLANLEATTVADVQAMLQSFWQRYLAGAGRVGALAVLGLAEPLDRPTIERRYRALASEHHPDRGGDNNKLAEINRAVEILRQYYPR